MAGLKRLDFSFSLAGGAWKKERTAIKKALREACAQAALKAGAETPAAISLRCVGKEEMERLNHQYRGRKKPTNVLSFTNGEKDERGVTQLGDIAVCLEVVAEEAAAQGKPFLHHLTHMGVHGTLHLLGHDHEEEGQAETMEALEVEILESFSISNPYL